MGAPAMPIDASKVQWDDNPDPAKVTWDDAPGVAAKGNGGAVSAPAIPPTSVLKRALHGLADPIYGAAQIADKTIINPIRQMISPGAASMDDVIRERDQGYVAPEGIDWARMGGNVANPVSWAGGGAGALRAAGQGALQASLAPVNPDQDFATQKATQAGLGAAGGAVLSKAMSGLTPTKEAKALMEQGIQPTVGQSLGGIANTVEQKLTSVPFVGDAINYARNRAQKEFEAAVIKRALGIEPEVGIGGIVQRSTKNAPRTLDEANVIASQKFDAVVPSLNTDSRLWDGVNGAVVAGMANPEMTVANRRILKGLTDEWFDLGKLSEIGAEGLKKLDSQIGYTIRKYAGGDPASKTLADELRNVQIVFRQHLNQMLPKNMKGALDEANTAYARLVPVNKAASARADERITPRALQRAMASQARTDISRMPADALVDSGVKVLPSTIPDSGTAGRAMLGGGALVGGGTLGVLPQMAAVGIPAGLGATRPVQRAIMGNTAVQKAISPYDTGLVAALVAALRGKKDEQ